MTPREAAIRFKLWASSQGLMEAQASHGLSVSGELEGIDSPSLTAAFGATAPTLLRKRITFVGCDDRANSVVVFTARKLTKKDKAALPDRLAGEIGVKYYHAGTAHTGAEPPPPFDGQPATLHNGRYCCGSSVFVGNAVGAGTLGCLVRNLEGIIFGLSNNHVTGGSNHSEGGLPIVAPGAIDVMQGGHDPFTIGHHHTVLPMVDGSPSNINVGNNTDAALFRIKDPLVVSSMQRDTYDTPPEVIPLESGMRVQKVGRTTGLTNGIVRAKGTGPHSVSYRHAERALSKVVYFDPVFVVQGTSGVFSETGDSGAIVTTEVDGVRKAVGLLFAGEPVTQTAYVLSLDCILARLGVTIVSGHNI